MKRTSVFLILVTVVFLVFFNKKKELQVPADGVDETRGRMVVQQSIRWAAAPQGQVSNVLELDVSLQLLSEVVPVEAQPFMIRAVKSAQVVENEKRAFPVNSPGDRLLDGLQRELFIDD